MKGLAWSHFNPFFGPSTVTSVDTEFDLFAVKTEPRACQMTGPTSIFFWDFPGCTTVSNKSAFFTHQPVCRTLC